MTLSISLEKGTNFIPAETVLKAFSFSEIMPDNLEYKHGVWSVKVNEKNKQTVYNLDPLNRTLVKHRVKSKE